MSPQHSQNPLVSDTDDQLHTQKDEKSAKFYKLASEKLIIPSKAEDGDNSKLD